MPIISFLINCMNCELSIGVLCADGWVCNLIMGATLYACEYERRHVYAFLELISP